RRTAKRKIFARGKKVKHSTFVLAIALLSTCDGARGSAFYLSNGVFTTLNITGGVAFGVNDSGVGASDSGGYVYSNGVFSTLNYPGSLGDDEAHGINNAGNIVGSALLPGQSLYSAYVNVNGSFTAFAAPGATSNGTAAEGINSAGQIVGGY